MDISRGRRVDLILVGAGLAGGVLMFAIGQYRQAFPALPAAWLLVPLAVCCAALLWRRTAPLVSVLVGVAAVVADSVLGPSLATVLIFTQVLYDACIHGREWLYRVLLAVSVVLTVVAAAVAIVFTRDVRQLGLAVLFAIVTVLPILTGIQVRHHREQARAERERAEQLSRLAELDRANAIAGERARMARELHDVIANHMSAVAIHATAALSVRDLSGDDVRQALTVIRENSVQGLAEMRQMIEFLRDPAAGGDAATAGLGAIGELLDRSRRAGLPTDLSVLGEPADLPVAIDLAAYRIVQESLTNALKHGGAGTTTVEIGYEPERLTIAVSSGLPAGAEQPTTAGGGAGVIGMRERTLLLGGDFEAGPRDGRWLVAARLPIGAEPA